MRPGYIAKCWREGCFPSRQIGKYGAAAGACFGEVCMITTISLSPAIDKRLEFDTFALGGTNRVAAVQAEGAGKAVNVALGARALGMDAVCAGILPFGGEPVTQRLACGGVRHDFFAPRREMSGSIKSCLTAARACSRRANESCPPAPEELLVRAQEQAAAYAAQSEFLVLTGSLPSGCPKDYYARVLRRAHEEAPACRCVLDAEGRTIRPGRAREAVACQAQPARTGTLCWPAAA